MPMINWFIWDGIQEEKYSKVMISKYVSIGNFGIRYAGKHKCSHNVCTSMSLIVSVCGCGNFSVD